MRTTFWLVLVALAFGLGAGIGTLIQPAERKLSTTIVDTPDAIGHPEGPDAARPKAGARSQAPEVGLPGADTPILSDDPLMQALKGLEFEQVETVEGSITASVTDEEGRPMAGVELRLYPGFPRESSQRMYQVDGTDEEFWNSVTDNARKSAAAMIRIWRNKLTAITDAEGRAEFTPLLDIPYTMRFTEDGRGLRPDREPYRLRPGDHVNWGLPALSIVRVTIEPCVGVNSVRVNARPDPSGPSTMNNEAPINAAPGETVEFKLRSDTWLISANAEKGSYVSDAVRVEVGDDGATHKVTLRLRPVARIRVELTYTGGTPRSSAHVWYAPVRADLNDDDHFDSRRNLAVVMNEAAGWRQVTGLEPGDYIVRARVQQLVQTRRVSAVAGENVVRFEFNAPAASDGIECVVEYPEDTAHPNFHFVAEIQYAEVGDRTHHQPARDVWKLGKNRYLLIDLWRGEEARVIAVSAGCSELGEVRQEVTRGKGEVLRFRFERPAALKVTVQDVPENLGKYVWVRVGAKSASMRSDTANFEGMQPGTSEVVLHYSGFDRFVLARASCDLRAGEYRELTMKMPPMYELVIEADRGEYSLDSITLQEDEKQTMRLGLGSDGRCILPWIPAGTYTLSYYKSNTRTQKQRTISIRSNATVRITD